MRVSQIGEFGLIDRLAGVIPHRRPDVVVGMGDDAAAVVPAEGMLLVASCDALLEGVHFRREFATPRQIGRKAIAVNLSDIAAVGGIPAHVLVVLGLPRDAEVEFVDELYAGLIEQAEEFGVAIVGGDTVLSPSGVMLCISMTGWVEPGGFVARGGARPGDILMVTGTLGASAAGLALLSAEVPGLEPQLAARAKLVHLCPRPRVKEGRVLGGSGCVTAMLDISDGLAAEVRRLAHAGGVGVRLRLEDVPVAPEARAVARATGRDPLELAVCGGEDYELLFAVPPGQAARVRGTVERQTGTRVTAVGEVAESARGVLAVDSEGRDVPLQFSGFDHFA